MRLRGTTRQRPPIHEVLWEFPLFDNLYMSMQAQNISVVDVYLEDLESQLLMEYLETEHTPIPTALFVSALSQMWVFAVYELLRTWRQRARELSAYAEKRKRGGTDGGPTLKQETPTLAEAIYELSYDRVETDPKFVQRLRSAYDRIDQVFRRIEALRMNLAKHEIPKKKGSIALAPGYGRIDQTNGSIYWMVSLGGNKVDMIS